MKAAVEPLSALKALLPEYLKRYYSDRIRKAGANRIMMRCPFHEDNNPSFSANNRNGTWLFHCFSCKASGSILDLHALTSGLNASSRENIESTAEAMGITMRPRRILSRHDRKKWAKHKEAEQNKERHEKRLLKKQEQVTKAIQSCLKEKLSPYCSDDWRADLWHSSPVRFDHPEAIPHDFIMCLFRHDEIIWMGEPEDSGSLGHKSHFRSCKDWLKLDVLPPRIAAGTFHSGCVSRSITNVSTAPYIVIESDDLIGHKPTTDDEKERNKSLSFALIGYTQKKLGLTLRAVIDTGNKSLHAWLDRPPDPELDAIRKMAPGLKIDVSILDRCQASPLRMPHCIHEKTKQPATLLYLNPITQ